AAALHEQLLCRRKDLRGVAARRPRLAEGMEAGDVDLDALTHRGQLALRLDGAGEVEPDLPGDELAGLRERSVVPHRQHVVEPVDTDPSAAQALGEPFPRTRGEDLLPDLRVAVLADIAGLGREDDRRLALARHEDIRIAVDDLEAGEVRHGALEA